MVVSGLQKVLTTDEMRCVDQHAIQEIGIASLVLMENAGTGLVQVMSRRWGSLLDKRVAIFCGGGNNGGDGLVVARKLLSLGALPEVYLLTQEASMSEECRTNLQILRRLTDAIELLSESEVDRLGFRLQRIDLAVDAMLGTGARGELRGLYAGVAERLNQAACPVMAVDIPTGVDAATGAVQTTAVKAEVTAALGYWKTGLLLSPGACYAGSICVIDIGIPPVLDEHVQRYLCSSALLKALPERSRWSHKGHYGHGLVVAGSQTMAGAAYLAAQAMLRSGAGVVTLAVPAGCEERIPAGEIMVVPVPGSRGCFAKNSIERLLELLPGKDVLALGPGLTTAPETVAVVEFLLTRWQGPLVLDADGLNALARLVHLPQSVALRQRQQWVLTPHPGEAARLLDAKAAAVDEQRMDAAAELHSRWGSAVLLKGVPTVIAGADAIYLNTTGNPGMSSAGMGDVLTGLVGGLLAQGMPPLLAAAAGAYVHGAAGDLAVRDRGVCGLTASDLLLRLGQVLEYNLETAEQPL